MVRTLLGALLRGDPVFQFNYRELALDLKFWRFAVPYLSSALWWPWRARNEEFVARNLEFFVRASVDVAEGVGQMGYGRTNTYLDGAEAPDQPGVDAGGGPGRVVETSGLASFEPSLSSLGARVTGAVHYPRARWMHCADFVQQLARDLQRKYGADVRCGVNVQALLAESGRVRALRCADGEDIAVEDGDAVLVCCGATTPELLEPLGVRTPIFPMKGYSITVQVPDELRHLMPSHMLVHKKYHMYVTPYPGGRLRFTSIAEFGGGFCPWDATQLPPGPSGGSAAPAGLEALRGYAAECHPELAPLLTAPGALELCGARPQSADDLPLVGAAPRYSNLFVNSGHGQYGWSLAAGSAEIVASHILGRPPPIEQAACLDPGRFDAFQAPWRRGRSAHAAG